MLQKLIQYFKPYIKEGVCIAFSGGVDSSLLLKAACLAREDLLSALDVGKVYVNFSVKTTRTEQSRVQNVVAVGCRHYDDAMVFVKAVHRNKNLVEGLFSLVVSTAKTCATATAYGVDFVDEDDTGLVFLRYFKEVAHTGRAHTHVHFYEVRTGNGEEGNTRFARYRLCKQSFTRARIFAPRSENFLGDFKNSTTSFNSSFSSSAPATSEKRTFRLFCTCALDLPMPMV